MLRRLAVIAIVALGFLAAPAGAQEQPAPTTTIPAGCAPPVPLALEFVGKVVAGDANVARFQVVQVRQGTPPGPLVDVDYSGNDDRRFVKDGETYLVAAAVDPESSRLVSKVRTPRAEPKACARYDPVYTNNADGSHIDSSVLSGVSDQSWEIASAFLIPAACVFAVLLGLVILKHSFMLTGRGVRYARDRRRSPRPRPPGPAGPAAERPPARRTRAHSAPPAGP